MKTAVTITIEPGERVLAKAVWSSEGPAGVWLLNSDEDTAESLGICGRGLSPTIALRLADAWNAVWEEMAEAKKAE